MMNSTSELCLQIIKLTRAAGDGDFYPLLNEFLRECVSFDELLVLQMSRNASAKLLYRYGNVGVENRLQGEDSWKYLTRLYVLDPFYRLYADKNKFGFFTLDEIGPEEFESIYNSYFNFLNLSDEIGFLFDLQDGTCLHIDLSRFGEEQKFDKASLAFLSQLVPALSELVIEHHAKLEIENEPETSDVEKVLLNFGKDLLTNKEYQVCQLLLQGYSTKNIAEQMKIGYETVKMHKKSIYSKTYMSSQSELLALFIDILQQEQINTEIDLLQDHILNI